MAKGGYRCGMPMGGMNQMQMMKQAQKMQEDMQALQAQLDEQEYTAAAGGGAGFERQLVRSVGHGAGRIFLSIRLQGAGKTACDE